MKRLLIVEDEKMIRQGIVVIVKRSSVEVEEILECRNGLEALEILKNCHVDVMFTDIRMPKMNGIELIKQVQKLPHQPKTIVVSGYDDFSYAVEALRTGVRDYILKPIEREQINRILTNLDQELQLEKNKEKIGRRISNHQLKYLIMNQRITEEEMIDIDKKFIEEMGDKEYIVACCHSQENFQTEASYFLQLSEIEEQSVFIMNRDKMEECLVEVLTDYCVGISGPHKGVRELKSAYEEALRGRKKAFVLCLSSSLYRENEIEDSYKRIPEEFLTQFVQLFGTDKFNSGLNKLENYYFQATKGIISPEQLLSVTQSIMTQLLSTYKNVVEMDMAGYIKLCQPLLYCNAKEFIEDFRTWMYQMNQLILTEFDDHRNKEKINTAVRYIKENYHKELNMAIVSNHISMNYSLFSLSFKQYTGVNFVNYLKMIRIQEAKRLLEETDEKVIDISQRVGYENEKHFMKTFKNVCGVSPSEYRKNMQMGKPI